ncbi:MAG: hypothetical protein LH624_16135, partial [Cryobacterium sp.]|nr:hypothetical protein [Cryobacterium sp.]
MQLTAKRDLYAHLMSQGMQNSAACRQVGVNRKTGQRWRLGRVVNDPKSVASIATTRPWIACTEPGGRRIARDTAARQCRRA